MRLIIAEKPSLGRAIAAVLPKPQRKEDGCIRCGSNDVVTWCFGHMLEQAQPDEYDPIYKQWRLEPLPIIPDEWKLKPRSDVRKQLTQLRRLIKEADELVHAGDPDREGQLLVDEVIDYCKVPQYKRKSLKRLLVSDLNPSAVTKALGRLRDNHDFVPLSTSALARSRADWLYGINLTRALTVQGRNAGFQGVLSVGRVQTPVLGLVVERDRAIENFVSKPFYEVQAHLLTPAGERFTASWQPSEACRKWQDEEGRVLSRALAENVARRITDKSAQVKSAERKPGSQSAPLPYNLSALQIDAAKIFGLSAQQVLDGCQSLYEKHRLITYPRSDCRYLPLEQLDDAARVAAALGKTENRLAEAVTGADLKRKSAAWNDSKVGAHHAIIPTTKAGSSGSLSDVERNIYYLVARQYLMQFYPPQRFNQTRLEIEIEGGLFIAKAKQITDPGWRVLMPSRDKAEVELPRVETGETLHSETGEVIDKMTQPPKAFTDATLLAAMTGIARFVADKELGKILKETDGLGTEATRAGIIELLFKRGFLSRQSKQIHATPAGCALVDALPARVTQPDMTAQWESVLNAISQREAHYQQFIDDMTATLRSLLADVTKEVSPALRVLKDVVPASRPKRSKRRSTGGRSTGKSAARKSSSTTQRKSGTTARKSSRTSGTRKRTTRSAN